MLHRRDVLLAALAASAGGFSAYADAPSDAAVQAILQECVGNDREKAGVVAVVSDPAGAASLSMAHPAPRITGSSMATRCSR
ncbi:MAG: hypothetical protein WB697_04105 [Stellaceae bacterium]